MWRAITPGAHGEPWRPSPGPWVLQKPLGHFTEGQKGADSRDWLPLMTVAGAAGGLWAYLLSLVSRLLCVKVRPARLLLPGEMLAPKPRGPGQPTARYSRAAQSCPPPLSPSCPTLSPESPCHSACNCTHRHTRRQDCPPGGPRQLEPLLPLVQTGLDQLAVVPASCHLWLRSSRESQRQPSPARGALAPPRSPLPQMTSPLGHQGPFPILKALPRPACQCPLQS